MTENTTTPALPSTAAVRGSLTRESNNMARTGRPKLGPGHRDDAMLAITEFIGLIAEMRKEEQDDFRLFQERYRIKRGLLDEMQARVLESSQSWRYGELVDEMMAGRDAA